MKGEMAERLNALVLKTSKGATPSRVRIPVSPPLLLLFLIFISFPVFAIEEGFAKNDEVEIFYRDYGPKENSPVLLIMGLGGQSTFWPDYFIDHLQTNGFRPIVFDNRDMGLSTRFNSEPSFLGNYIKYYLFLPVRSEYKLDDMADDAVLVMDHLQIEQTHLIGMSMGGMISQIIAANYSDRIKSYTQIASMAQVPSPLNGPSRKVMRLLNERVRADDSLDERVDRAVRLMTTIGMPGYDYSTPEVRQEIIEGIERSEDDSGFIRQMAAILATDGRLEKVKQIEDSTLIIHGKQDPLIHVRNAYYSHDIIANSDLVIIENMGHLIEEEVFVQFKEDLVEHLKSNET